MISMYDQLDGRGYLIKRKGSFYWDTGEFDPYKWKQINPEEEREVREGIQMGIFILKKNAKSRTKKKNRVVINDCIPIKSLDKS